MAVLSLDLGGTKLSVAIFSDECDLIQKQKIHLEGRQGAAVGDLIVSLINKFIEQQESKHETVKAIGISVPGIVDEDKGTVWAPNIKGWEEFPLKKIVCDATGDIPVVIENDRACYITGEVTKGIAKGCKDAVYIAVGTGIGAGIISGGHLLKGAMGISGSVGWMALDRPFSDEYRSCGYFESKCSGEGIARVAKDKLQKGSNYTGLLNKQNNNDVNAKDVFEAFKKGDPLAKEIIAECIELWGMALANIVSLLNPEMVIFGGGVFGPAADLIPAIIHEAGKWAQPVSMNHVKVVATALGEDAGLYGAATLALKKIN